MFLGLAALLASTAIVACTASGHAEGEGRIDPPFVPPIDWKISATMGEYEIEGGEEHANKCVKVTWTDSEGAEISSETLETDGSGSASGQVPAGAVRWEAKVVDCPEPEPEPEEKASGGMFDPQGIGVQQTQKRIAVPRSTREFFIYGAPIVPSQAPGADNLTYSFLVTANSYAQAENLVAPIIAGGIGTPVPPSVKVITFSTMEAGIAGGRVVSAMPGLFQSFQFDFNNGAFTADLQTGHNTINYQINNWDVVEMVVPLSAFDFGFSPGVTYSNTGDATYTTDWLLGPVSAGYDFNYSN
jgi:hypothetical protein